MVFINAGGENRTRTSFRSRDFKSLVSACFTTPAYFLGKASIKKLCGVLIQGAFAPAECCVNSHSAHPGTMIFKGMGGNRPAHKFGQAREGLEPSHGGFVYPPQTFGKASAGFAPANRGFADLSVSYFTTTPKICGGQTTAVSLSSAKPRAFLNAPPAGGQVARVTPGSLKCPLKSVRL